MSTIFYDRSASDAAQRRPHIRIWDGCAQPHGRGRAPGIAG